MWMVVWAAPFLLAACGFFLQNFQLRIGTYQYVHKMLQYDLLKTQTKNASNYTEFINLTIGQTPQDVSFGSLEDPLTKLIGPYQKVDISTLDMLAALFPFLFVVLALAMDKPMIVTRVLLCFFVLAVGKGVFAWITVMPDSNGWQVCQGRLSRPGGYSVEWYAKERSLWEIFRMDPRTRLCADMMWSGHTYFVTIFAFGLHELVRTAMRANQAKHRILVESLVATAAIAQQSVEIYYVLTSRFHYTSDVVMAIFVTYLLYTNSTIAVLAAWWSAPGPGPHGYGGQGRKSFWGKDHTSKWLTNGLGSEGSLSLGCCCCAFSRQWIYDGESIYNFLTDLQDATEDFPEKNDYKLNKDSRYLLIDGMGLLHKDSVYVCTDSESEEEEEKEYEEVSFC